MLDADLIFTPAQLSFARGFVLTVSPTSWSADILRHYQPFCELMPTIKCAATEPAMQSHDLLCTTVCAKYWAISYTAPLQGPTERGCGSKPKVMPPSERSSFAAKRTENLKGIECQTSKCNNKPFQRCWKIAWDEARPSADSRRFPAADAELPASFRQRRAGSEAVAFFWLSKTAKSTFQLCSPALQRVTCAGAQVETLLKKRLPLIGWGGDAAFQAFCFHTSCNSRNRSS